MSSLASGNKLQPSVLHDTTGPYAIVTCGSVSGRLYLSKLDESKKPLPKCINVNGTWHSPPDVESLAGKKSKKWKQSLRHLDKPLSDFNLSVLHVITSQQGSSDNVNITVADNIDVSVSYVSGHVSDNQSVSTSPTAGFTGLSVTLPMVSQVGSVSSHTSCPIVPPC